MSFNSNPLYSQQWHFNLIGDIETIWAEYSGDGVVVAVYDDGVEQDHPDLVDNYDESLELPYDDGDPNTANDGHGTACAGIIGAANNGEGGIGVAWGATITGIDFLEDIQGNGAAAMLQSLYDMENYDVISNSWGTSGFNSFWNDIFQGNSGDAAAMDSVAKNGRDGLGSIVVKAAGNDANTSNPSSQNDGLNVVRQVITVAATDSSGNTMSYSNWGMNLLIAAPAAAVTTDLTGTGNGYDWTGVGDDDYTNGFGGTSAATPVISGVVALILQANPDLGWRDVQQIIAMSASQTGSNFGAAASGFEDGEWFSNGASNWNGGGLSYHINYGFGMIDAFAAVRMAEAWSLIKPTAQTSYNEESVVASANGGALAFGDFQTVQKTVSVAQDIDIETIYVELDLSHNWTGALTIVLVAPDGTEFILNESNGTASMAGYTFGVKAALGMSSQGTWTVKVSDTDAFGDSGSFVDVDLHFYGSLPKVDDVYHFTDDFLALEAVEGARANITDTNGGTDWLNLAAVTGDVLWDFGLFTGVRFLAVDTVRWVDFGNNDIENIVTGDGNDYLWGTGASNEFHAGRGNDKLFGLAGEDILNGGAGDDELTGGFDADQFIYNGGSDIIQDFTSQDLVFIDRMMWGGTIESLLATASLFNGDLRLDFGAGNFLTFNGVTSTTTLQGKIFFEGDAPLTGDVAFDFNGDGTSDVLWRNPVTGQMGLYLMDDGSPSWKSIGGSNTNWDVIGTGDFNSDGTTDILWRNPTDGKMGLYLMDDGSPSWKNLGTSNPSWDIVGTGDFNGDGTDDILWRNLTTGRMGTDLMDDGSKSWKNLGTSNTDWDVVGTGDFNGDGVEDILWRNLDTGQMGLDLMDANASKSWQKLGTSNTDWDVVGTGDFNGDGTDDILWRNLATGQMGMDLMDGGAKSWKNLGTSNTAWDVVGTGDYNGDGVEDILWRNLTSGDMGMYLMDENANKSWQSLGSSNPNWNVEGYFDDVLI